MLLFYHLFYKIPILEIWGEICTYLYNEAPPDSLIYELFPRFFKKIFLKSCTEDIILLVLVPLKLGS